MHCPHKQHQHGSRYVHVHLTEPIHSFSTLVWVQSTYRSHRVQQDYQMHKRPLFPMWHRARETRGRFQSFSPIDRSFQFLHRTVSNHFLCLWQWLVEEHCHVIVIYHHLERDSIWPDRWDKLFPPMNELDPNSTPPNVHWSLLDLNTETVLEHDEWLLFEQQAERRALLRRQLSRRKKGISFRKRFAIRRRSTWITPPPVVSACECKKSFGRPIIFASQSITTASNSVHAGLDA